MRAAVALAALAAVAACSQSEPTVIDGSSPEAFARTTGQARQEVSNRDKLVFDRAIRSAGGRRHSADPEELARITFDGMTGNQVVADQRAREK